MRKKKHWKKHEKKRVEADQHALWKKGSFCSSLFNLAEKELKIKVWEKEEKEETQIEPPPHTQLTFLNVVTESDLVRNGISYFFLPENKRINTG